MDKPLLRTVRTLLTLALTAAVLLWAFNGVGFSVKTLAEGAPKGWEFVRGMFPPDLSREFLVNLRKPLLATVQMAIVGTMLGALAAFPVSFLAAKTVAFNVVVSSAVKSVLNALRAVPSLIYALMLIHVVGLGEFAGSLGLAVGAFGMLGKLFAESLENLDPKPIEAVKAAGGAPAQVFAYAMLPQVLPNFLAQSLYAFELNLRDSFLLGIVGAGGIGYELQTTMRLFRHQETCTILLLIMLIVIAVDTFSYLVRRRVT